MSVTIEDIKAAARVIAGQVNRTPCPRSVTLSSIFAADVFLKFENLQFTASFKERGALNRLAALSSDERGRGVIAMSAGNHAQAVAHHARRLGIDATIVMPRITPFNKVRNTEMLGARVVLHGDSLSDAAAHACAIAEREGRVFIHPYDDPRIIAGQGTATLEMLEAVPDLDTIVVAIGGGGLIAGAAIAARAHNPEIEVIGVEAALYPAMAQVLRGEAPTAHGVTIAEGIAVKEPGAITRDIVRQHVCDIMLVDESELERAVLMMIEIEKVVAEGAGAAPLAAMIQNPERFHGRRVGLMVSGGNIDSRLLAQVLMRGLVRTGRMIRLRVEVNDLPGTLARAAELIGAHGGNIIEVEHQRWMYDVPVKLTVVDILLEIRDEGNGREIAAALNAAGMPARQLSTTAEDSGRAAAEPAVSRH